MGGDCQHDADSNLIADRIITEGEFGGSAAFREFELAYTLPFTPTPRAYQYPVSASLQEPELLLQQQDHGIDVRVWWYDQVNTYLDYVVLEDSVIHPNYNGAYQLFRGERDSLMLLDAQHFASDATYPLLQRFYLKDEPRYNGYQPFNYADQFILNNAGIQGIADGRGRGITATPNYAQGSSNVYAGFTRFMNDGRPYELFVDVYPIHAGLPAPTSFMPAGAADSAGVAPYTGSGNYNALLQGTFDDMIANSLLPAIETAISQGLGWWYIAQVHGELDFNLGRYRRCDNSAAMLRPPSPAEIRAMVYLSLAYGAKGVFYFAYPTWAVQNFGGCAAVRFPGLVAEGSEQGTPDHSGNYDTFNNVNVFTGYQAKYQAVAETNRNLQIVGPELAALDWQGAHTSGESPGGSIVQNIVGGDYIEIGDFTHPTSGENYFLLVNRRCDDGDTQTLTVTLTSSGSRRLIEDVLASRMPWDGHSNRVAYRTLDAGETDFVVTLNPGEGRLFRVSSGLSDTLAAARYWSGEVYVNNNLTVNSGVPLTIERATAVAFAQGRRLTIKGSLQATGTSSQGIIFDRSGTTGTWSGIWIENATAASNLAYCTVRNTGNAIRLKNTPGAVTIDHATLTNNYVGFMAEYSSPFTIQHSTIQNNSGYGIWVVSSAAAGMMKILSNLIAANGAYHGIYLYNGADAYIGFNTITGHAQHGISCNANSDPIVRSVLPMPDYGNNLITNNGGAGVNTANNSYPSLGHDVQVDSVKDKYGYNEIHDNSGDEIINGSGSNSIKAERNYWSANHDVPVIPPAEEFTGAVDYLPVLPEIPSLAAGNANAALKKGATDFAEAFALEIQDDLQAAADLYAKLLESDPAAANAGFGVSGLIRCYIGLDRRGDIVTRLDDLIAKFPKTALATSAQDHSLPYLVQIGRCEEALDRALDLLEQNREFASREADYLFRAASLYQLMSSGDAENNRRQAADLYQELLDKYPDSDYALVAELELSHLGMEGLARPAAHQSPAFAAGRPALHPNHPNPFNPETRIRFDLRREQQVELRIFDLSGRLVRRLLSGFYSAGEHVVRWDGRDESGTPAASGIYFAELRADGQKQRIKMTLMR
ncbi:right-handed parallel beta-helix repeat-containing protein [candidate division KSB1 bacterium]|nr:right-handed parallel beta-helix repeat-containing protein [candidate division KSB1 bacterium]